MVDHMTSAPFVSVCMITYQHAPYVAQAIDSILAQKTDFPFELVIGEDGSTDGTLEICRNYAGRYPGIIRLITRDRTAPGRQHYAAPFMFNYLETLKACRGQYLAVCEGDDYWIASDKLQRQTEVMESDGACTVCFCAAIRRGADFEETDYPPGRHSHYAPETLFAKDYIINATVMYRNIIRGHVPEWFAAMPVGDWPMHLLHAARGHIRYIDEPMAVYRFHPGGVWSPVSMIKRLQCEIRTSKKFMRLFPVEFHKNQPLLNVRQRRADLLEARRKYVAHCLVWGNKPFRGRLEVIKILLSGHLPATTLGTGARLLFRFFVPWRKKRHGR